MSASPPIGERLEKSGRLMGVAYAWALALVTGLDYFDSALFSYFAGHIAGGVNASPDELVWASSSYAVAAVLGILQQQWWGDRLGARRYIVACMLIYAIGALLSAICETPSELMLTRALQGYCIGPMMGTCRILLQSGEGFAPGQTAGARRLFLMAITVASALAPIAGGQLLSHFEWRALFACTAPVGFLLAGFALFAVPDIGRTADVEQTGAGAPSHLGPYLAFALAQGALQVVLQQLHFQLFTSSAALALLLLVAFAALGAFAYHQWHHPRPLVHLHTLREKSFRVGLLLYVFYYCLSTSFGYLVLRFLEQGLSYPVENAGWFVGTTSLISTAMLVVYFRYSPRVTRKKWLIVPGFGVAALSAWLMAHMTPDVDQRVLVLPLVLRGMLVMFIAVPVANLTFRAFQLEAFSHSYRLKNIIRQLAVSFATSSVIVLERHRQELHYTRLAKDMDLYNLWFSGAFETLTRGAEAMGQSAVQAHALALAQIEQMVVHQADFLAILDGFYFLAAMAICMGLIALWQHEIK